LNNSLLKKLQMQGAASDAHSTVRERSRNAADVAFSADC
jgi:hypothetical protein